MPNKITFTKNEIKQIINLYQSGLSCKQIGKQFNCSKQVINQALKERNIPMRDASHAHQKYRIDENVFNKIDTQEKAYWLGMLTGDGWIDEKGGFGLSLEQNDKELVYMFRDFLKSEHPVAIKDNGPKRDGTRSISYEVRITNQQIISDLKRYNFVPNKTHHMEFPKIPDQFLPDYMLGLIDSDGCICRKNPNKWIKRHTLCFSFVGPTEFVEKFQNILIEKCGISKTQLDIQKNTDFIRIVVYSGYKNIFRIVKFLYSNAPFCMQRKKKIAIDFLLTKYPNDEWLLNHISI